MTVCKDRDKGLMWITFSKNNLKGIRNTKRKLSDKKLPYTITEDLYYDTIFFEVYLTRKAYNKYYKGV